MNEDQYIFTQDGLKVLGGRIEAGSSTYLLRDITGVRCDTVRLLHKDSLWIVYLFLAGFCLASFGVGVRGWLGVVMILYAQLALFYYLGHPRWQIRATTRCGNITIFTYESPRFSVFAEHKQKEVRTRAESMAVSLGRLIDGHTENV